jgi:putative ABC transport system permease protein
VLLAELAILVLLAQPLCWGLGYAFGWLTIQSFSSDIYRAPLVINAATYAMASLIVIASAAAASLVILHPSDRVLEGVRITERHP